MTIVTPKVEVQVVVRCGEGGEPPKKLRVNRLVGDAARTSKGQRLMLGDMQPRSAGVELVEFDEKNPTGLFVG